MPPLLADFTHARPCKPFCEKYLTLPKNDMLANFIMLKVNHFIQNTDNAIKCHNKNTVMIDLCGR